MGHVDRAAVECEGRGPRNLDRIGGRAAVRVGDGHDVGASFEARNILRGSREAHRAAPFIGQRRGATSGDDIDRAIAAAKTFHVGNGLAWDGDRIGFGEGDGFGDRGASAIGCNEVVRAGFQTSDVRDAAG